MAAGEVGLGQVLVNLLLHLHRVQGQQLLLLACQRLLSLAVAVVVFQQLLTWWRLIQSLTPVPLVRQLLLVVPVRLVLQELLLRLVLQPSLLLLMLP